MVRLVVELLLYYNKLILTMFLANEISFNELFLKINYETGRGILMWKRKKNRKHFNAVTNMHVRFLLLHKYIVYG